MQLTKSQKTAQAELLAKAKAKVAANKAKGAKAETLALAKPEAKALAPVQPAKVPTERRKGDATKGIKAPKAEAQPATTTTEQPAPSAPTVQPLAGQTCTEVELSKHGCRKMQRRTFNDNLAVAAALHTHTVAVHPTGSKGRAFAFVGDAERTKAAADLYVVLRFAYYEGDWAERATNEGVSTSRGGVTDYCNAWGVGCASKADFVPSAELLAAAKLHGEVIALNAQGSGYHYNSGLADGARCDFAQWFARWAKNAHVSATLPACLTGEQPATEQPAPTEQPKQLQTKRRGKLTGKQPKQLAA